MPHFFLPHIFLVMTPNAEKIKEEKKKIPKITQNRKLNRLINLVHANSFRISRKEN